MSDNSDTPGALKDIDPVGTGLSDVAASFVAAHCSPFTNPRNMPTAPKVPDPRNTQMTDTMMIWGRFEIPVVNTGSAGEQTIMSSADPLAPVPVVFAMTNSDSGTACYNSPMGTCRIYEDYGLQQMVYQMRALGQRAKRYRVVGHGLKVWVSKNTNISRGHIEGGQFSVSQTRNANRLATESTAAATAGSRPTGSYYQHNLPCATDRTLGWQVTASTSLNLQRLRQSIESAKDQELGFLAADDGCTVRWTDSNNFQFQDCRDRGYAHLAQIGWPVPSPSTYLNWAPYLTNITSVDGYPLPDAQYNAATYTSIGSLPLFNCTYAEGTLTTSALTLLPNSQNKLGTFISRNNTINPSTVYPGFNTKPNTVAAGDLNQVFYTVEGQTQDAMLRAYTAENQFDTGLYVDVVGVDTTQILTVQVVWHIEYEPKGNEGWASTPSPVDTRFDELSAMVRNSAAFPIVVKGHSFFSSLRRAIGRMFSTVSKVVVASAPLVSRGLEASGDPRLMAIGAGIGTAGGVLSQLMRKRAAVDDAE